MHYHYKDLGHVSAGTVIRVDLEGNQANVKLMDSSNYRQYVAGEQHRFYGRATVLPDHAAGPQRRSLVRDGRLRRLRGPWSGVHTGAQRRIVEVFNRKAALSVRGCRLFPMPGVVEDCYHFVVRDGGGVKSSGQVVLSSYWMSSRSVSSKLAKLKLAPLKSARHSDARVKSAPHRSAPDRSAKPRLAPMNFVTPRRVPFKFALVRVAPAILAWDRSAFPIFVLNTTPRRSALPKTLEVPRHPPRNARR